MELISSNVIELMNAYDNEKINFDILNKFILSNSPITATLTSLHGKENVLSFVDKTIKHIKILNKENGNKEDLRILTNTLRLCAREEDLFGSTLFEKDTISFLFELAGFSINGDSEMNKEWDNIKSEAIKCLVNMFIRAFNASKTEESSKNHLIEFAKEKKVGFQIVNKIKSLYQFHTSTPSAQISTDQVSDFMIFTRILFHLTLHPSFVTDFLNHKEFSVAKLITQCGLVCIEEEREKKYKMVLIDVLKVLYNLTERFGPVANDRRENPSPKLIDDCFLLGVPILKHVLALEIASTQDLDTKVFSMNFAINIPPNIWISHFDGRKVIPELIELFKVFMEEEIKKQQFVTPMLVLLANIAKHIPPTRNVLFPLLFPVEIEEREDLVKPPVQIKGTFGEKIMQLMFSNSDTLKVLSGEFLWEVVGEDASNLSRTIGFGNAAGFLAYKGMLKMFNPGGDGDIIPNIPSEGGNNTNIDDNSEEKRKYQEFHFQNEKELHELRKTENEHHKEPTVEEIREWEELMEKFEKLEKLGIKVHMKTKNDDEKDDKK
eukprot:TRINITY_DN5549_c0_g1_i1.p1 TRINITY_DN5549_c0_g1~~TRINITY_DN5549_c0_g1_i1.p1  ORF type:complete len:548 (+),score=191.27 TRINITY_DN5549_c0_g1_i1:345-1988(+)